MRASVTIAIICAAVPAGVVYGQQVPPKPSASPTAPPTPATAPFTKQQLAAEMKTIDEAIKAAEEETARYSGGLVKSLIDVRLATLRQTRAMLAQRTAAGDFNVTLRYSVDGRTLTLPASAKEELASVEREVEETKRKIQEQQAEADRYSGGLIQAMSLSTVATSKQTLAMLEQKRLALKYNLPQFIGFRDAFTSSSASTATAPSTRPSPPPTAPAPPSRQWEIVSVDSKVTESNDTWWKFAWKLTIRNKGTTPVALTGTIEFQDKDGFVVDDDDTDAMIVPAGSEQTFTGYDLVTTASARSVAATNAKVREAR